jgi:hypothetical protein
MTTPRCIIGSLVGGLVLFLLGYPVYGILFMEFFETNTGSATGVPRESIGFLSLWIGQWTWGGLLTIILGWNGTRTITGGLCVGATVGFLLALGINLTMYATSNVSNLAATLVDPLLAMVLFALAGAAIVAAVGRGGD